MIRGAIFDLDGTLLESMEIWEHAAERFLSSIGHEAERGLNRKLYNMSMEEGASYVKAAYCLDVGTEEIIRGIHDIIGDYYRHEAKLKPGAQSLLTEFKGRGIPMVLATSNDRKVFVPALERLGIMGDFKEILTCTEVGEGKTRPLIYMRAAEVMGTKPCETWVFEDVLHAVKTASKAGFKTVGVYDRFGEEFQEELKRYADIYMCQIEEPDSFFAKASG